MSASRSSIRHRRCLAMGLARQLIVFPAESHRVLNDENSRFWYAEVHARLAKRLNVSSTSTPQ